MSAAVLVAAAAAMLQASPDSARVVGAHRVAAGEQAPVVDGRLDDAVWSAAPVAGDFVQQRPSSGQPPSQRTEARVVYDDDAVYVAVRAFDTAPDSITAQLGRRDATGIVSDWVQVIFDSYHDRRTGFRFGVTPRGVVKDAFHYDDGNEDATWDAVWTAATRIDSLGWTAEFRIPFSQLRFRASAGEQTWGFNVLRDLARKEERSYWSPMPQNQSGFVSRFGTLTGLRGLRSPRRLELLPYAVTRVTRDERVADDDPFRSPTDPSLSLGGDLKYGLTSNLTLTATFNPDFGQVEADPGQVNLTAFETFFQERRPFFVEGVDVFNFGIGGGDALFYSRRIGRRPQGDVGPGKAFVDAPQATTILGAAKLTGRTGGWTVGVLDAVTAEERTRFVIDDVAGVEEAVTEPMTNYGVARVRRDFRRGQTSVGAIATSVHRRLGNDDGLEWLPNSAYAGGVDWRHRFLDGAWQFNGFLLQSSVQGDTLAIQRLQRSPARLFHRPDADHVDFDPLRTSLSGSAGLVALNKIAGTWRTGSGLVYRSPGFEVNDLGFLQGADRLAWDIYVGYNRVEPQGPFRNYSVFSNHVTAWSTGGERAYYAANLNGNFMLKNLWSGFWGVNRNIGGLSVAQLRGGPALRTTPTTEAWAGFFSDRRKPLSFGGDMVVGREHGTDGGFVMMNGSVNVRPSSRFDLTLSPQLRFIESSAQYVATRADANAAGTPEWVFAPLDHTTASLTARLNYIFTPRLSLQFYAQPFISAGEYDALMEVENPRARRFGERFRLLPEEETRRCTVDGRTFIGVRPRGEGCGEGAGFSYRIFNPDFNVRQLNSNAVLRWEYRPGSTLFVVWSQGRSDFASDGRFRLGPNTADLFRAPGTNVLLIKASYWLDF
ncbi:MAG: carbohydrate binding family 9 domain-containing protein [Gemmatimonadetes bacterium]|nr:carbohydrate binding family 9 domain-containing protein [Gemmatimonadota bacterium]